MRALWLFSVFFILVLEGRAQLHEVPLSEDYERYVYNSRLIANEPNLHHSLRPYRYGDIYSYDTGIVEIIVEYPVIDELHLEPLLSGGKKDLFWSVNPTMKAMAGFGRANDTSDQSYNLGIGLEFKSNYRNKLAFYAHYEFSQNTYTDYVQSSVSEKSAIPSLGNAEVNGEWFRNHYLNTYLVYAPTEYLNFQIGNGRSFIGRGYRSLILSDNSAPNPYGKITLTLYKFKYQVLYSMLQTPDLTGNSVSFNYDKFTTSNYLSMNVGKNYNVGLFQTVIWERNNETFHRGFDVNYLNPIVFMRPIEFSVGSPDNVLLGLDMSYTVKKQLVLYTQLMLDEFLLEEVRAQNGWWGNKYAYQFGFKWYDVLRYRGTLLQMEYNHVRPFTYTHSNPKMNYGHHYLSMAHPLEANFDELVGRLSFVRNKWLFAFHSTYAVKGEDYDYIINTTDDIQIKLEGNYGGNIFESNTTRISEYGNETGQGNRSDLTFIQARVGYMIVPSWKLMAEFSYTFRQRMIELGTNEYSQMFQIGFRTTLYNQYFDF